MIIFYYAERVGFEWEGGRGLRSRIGNGQLAVLQRHRGFTLGVRLAIGMTRPSPHASEKPLPMQNLRLCLKVKFKDQPKRLVLEFRQSKKGNGSFPEWEGTENWQRGKNEQEAHF